MSYSISAAQKLRRKNAGASIYDYICGHDYRPFSGKKNNGLRWTLKNFSAFKQALSFSDTRSVRIFLHFHVGIRVD